MQTVMRALCAIAFLLPLSLSAATTNVVMATSDGRTAEVDVPSSDEVHLIVEFRDTPLFAHRHDRVASDTATAMRAFDLRFAQFATDIRSAAPRITHTFERVFAG